MIAMPKSACTLGMPYNGPLCVFLLTSVPVVLLLVFSSSDGTLSSLSQSYVRST